MEDEKIVELYWQRDESAITCTKEKYESYLYAVANRILTLSEDVEETVSDTYIGAWNAMPPEKPHILRTFLGRITRNLSLKRFRRDHAQKRCNGETDLVLDELAEVVSSGDAVEDEAERKELVRAIQKYLAELKPAQRQIFLARYWYLYPVAEIAQRLGCTQSKVKMTLKRTRDSLRETLVKEGLL